ncbi:aspartate aminotransferase family protein [Paenibacillus whitsoniae]|uniref:Aspartate aminotransferase family protein n=1 Tax=Paenibacillus whitsoniae TaxID=2496558 RepID=A0A430JHI3_9BACL|nr:aspartate aminotransferase family protein [Paenibacillus whitsoniae]RTE10527.1 aspartate aminotransferase family protein [Paenibacillus whitsoniae]
MFTYERSKISYERAKQHLAGGVASSLRASMKPFPLYADSAKGARLQDIDNHTYIDYLLAYGPLILGHAHDGLTESILSSMRKGYTYGLQHEGEIELADLLVEVLPCADKVAFSGSGTEAVMLALRLARAHTGKSKIVRFHGHYHGWSDAIFTSFPGAGLGASVGDGEGATVSPGTSGQSANSLDDVILLPWNDPEVLASTLRSRSGEIAAVISEPVMCNSGCLQPKPGYLELIRQLTNELGIVFILDEVITGFRLGLGGAHGRFGIKPDLVTIGKAMGGGIAISAVAGSNALMKLIDTSAVNHLGTLNGNGVATAAALTTIRELAQQNGAAFKRMEELFVTLSAGIRGLLSKHGIPGVVNQCGPVLHMMFIDEPEVADFDTFNKRDAGKYARFAELMLSEGVLLRPNGLWYISTAHSLTDIDETLLAVDRALSQLE